MEAEAANAYTVLFSDEDFPQGATRLLHAPRRFSAKMGHPSKYDDRYVAFLDDVFGGMVQVVEFKAELFDCTGKINVPVDLETTLKMWEDDCDATLLPPLKHNKETIRVTKMIYVPAQLIDLFMGQRFTPRQLMEDVYPLLVADGVLEDLKPFIQWMVDCGTSTGTERATSPLLLPEVKVPLMDLPYSSGSRTSSTGQSQDETANSRNKLPRHRSTR
jgi:hypothetical protein